MCFNDSRNITVRGSESESAPRLAVADQKSLNITGGSKRSTKNLSASLPLDHRQPLDSDKVGQQPMTAPGQFYPDLGLTPGRKKKLAAQSGSEPPVQHI